MGQPQKTEQIKFHGVDMWGRPVFKSTMFDKNFFGSTDKLFDDEATEEEVLKTVTEQDLLFFGNTFGCEPMGDPVKGTIEIVRI